MYAMEMQRICDLTIEQTPLARVELPLPQPKRGEIRLRVEACGVCHTELDEIEGRTPPPRLPMVPGHEVVGRVDACGDGSKRFRQGQRLGVGWIHSSTGDEHENLAPEFVATGRDVNGGYAEYMIVPEAYAYPIPDSFSSAEAAPLLCAGAVGYRALRLCGLRNGESLGLTGFGASAHLVLQLAQHLLPASPVHVFARDEQGRAFAREHGAAWVGAIGERSPIALRAIIDTTPAWRPVVEALTDLAPGGRLVVNAIRKEAADQNELLRIDYAQHLWCEKEVKSVANVCGADIGEFLPLAERAGIRPQVKTLALDQANTALLRLKRGGVRGALVLVP